MAEQEIIEIPEWWAICQNRDCRLSVECLRYKVFERLGATVETWSCVMPGAKTNDECHYYVKDEKVRLARGFDNMFARIRSRDDIYTMRRELTDYLGSVGTYYRFKSGERLLSPEQQQWILQLFSKHGYQDGIEFDEYVDTYYFKRPL